MCTVIAIANQKGGVGKSTTSINLGVGLVNEGKRVLIIDNDPQGNCTAALGYPEPDAIEHTLATIIDHIVNEDEFDLLEGILHNVEGVDLLPGNIELAGVETAMVNIYSSETSLKEYVDMIRHRYDYIIIDCSPNLAQLTMNALTCADYVLVPVQAAYLPIIGLMQLLKTIGLVKRKMNPDLKIMGILLTMVDFRTNYAKEIMDKLHSTYGNNICIFDAVIPLSVRAAESSAVGLSIYAHDPKGKVAKAYEALTREVLAYE